MNRDSRLQGGPERLTSEIVATGYAYPSLRVDNVSYAARAAFALSSSIEELAAETRIVTRTWCAPGETTYTMARDAVAMALATAPELKEEIDVVIVASGTTMPVLHPALPELPGAADLAPLLVRDLGRRGVLGLDIKACYCSGFLRGLELMDALLARSPSYRAGLVVATEQGSRLATAASNRSTFCFLMADAAGAAVLRKRPVAPRRGIVDQVGYTDGEKVDWIAVGDDGVSMRVRGARAAEVTHELLVECARTLLVRNGLTPADVDWLVPIQTHARVIDGLQSALEWPKGKLLWSGDVRGFSGSASIPSRLSEAIHDGTIRKGDLVLSLAVGAGLNCAGTLFYV